MDLTNVSLDALWSPFGNAPEFDYSHPFCRSACLLYANKQLRNESSLGGFPVPAFSTTNTFLEANGPCGRTMRKNSSGDLGYLGFGTDSRLQISSMTCVIVFSVDSVATTTCIWSNGRLSTDNNFLMFVDSSGRVNLARAGTPFYTATTALKAGRMHAVAFAYDAAGATGSFAVDGKLDPAITTGTSAYTFEKFYLGDGGSTSAENKNRVHMIGITPTIMTKADVLSLSADPWQILAEEVDLFVNLRTAAGGGIVGPLIGARHLLGGGALIGGRLVMDRHERKAA